MPTITINGRPCAFKPGQPPPMIIQVANENGIEIPQYCYHDGLSIVASCRICLAEVWQPNPRNNNQLEPIPKLVPTCQTACADGMVVYTDSPKSVANQKAVMEYLLINHPLDCPVCDQAGECLLQDYSYQYGRGSSRFEEAKVKNPKKDLGPHVYLYADRCIMCTRCVRFTREVSGTSELMVQGRGNKEEIDVFPGTPLANELSVNVVDLCPVGALLEKDFLFAQRVWFLKRTPSIDGLTASGNNIYVEHNEGKVYRIKPRTNMAVNKWWITDEVRYSWKHVHSQSRLRTPLRRQFGTQVESDWSRAYRDAIDGLRKAMSGGGGGGKRITLMVSPMLTCEDAFTLAEAARAIDSKAVLAVGPIPVQGQDKVLPAGDPNGFRVFAEKCPNSRGVKRVLGAIAAKSGQTGGVLSYEGLLAKLRGGEIGGVILTGNYPSDWTSEDLLRAVEGKFLVLIDTLPTRLTPRADIVLPGATWVEKAGTFQNARDLVQGFEQAIPVLETARAEGEIGQELLRLLREPRAAAEVSAHAMAHAVPSNGATFVATVQGMHGHGSLAGVVGEPHHGGEPEGDGSGPTSLDRSQVLHAVFNPAGVRQRMARAFPAELGEFATISAPAEEAMQQADMEVVEL